MFPNETEQSSDSDEKKHNDRFFFFEGFFVPIFDVNW